MKRKKLENNSSMFVYTPYRSDEPDKSVNFWELLIIGLVLAGALAWLKLSEFQEGSLWIIIRDVATGLGGYLCYVLPLLPCLFTSGDDNTKFVDILLVLSFFSCIHIIYTSDIITEGSTINSFTNFVATSYSYGKGGGAIGALLAWPLYRYLGEQWGLIVAFFLFILCLAASGRLGGLTLFSSSMKKKEQPQNDEPTYNEIRSKYKDWKHGSSAENTSTGDASLSPPVPRKSEESMPKHDTVTDFFDDYDPMDPQEIIKYSDDSPRTMKPDRPSSLERPSVDDARPHRKKLYIEGINLEDDLKIEPRQYDALDDEMPFDIPNRQRVKKENLPKIEKDEMKILPEEDAPEYSYPLIDLLEAGEAEDVSKHARQDRERARLIENTLNSFGIQAKLTGIAHSPVMTRFELQPAPGVKISRISSLCDDIAMTLAAKYVQVEAPIPGKSAVGLLISNATVETVHLRDVLESREAQLHPSKIAVGLGKDSSGRFIVADLSKLRHVLIAGQMGSGKSTCIYSIITSLLYRATPEEVRLILIDPKILDLACFNDIPHLVCPVVTDPKKAASALDWAVAEMTRRYKLFTKKGVRDIKGYNRELTEIDKPLPQMVIIIDELSDLMMVSPGEVEDCILRLTQLGNVCGIHLVIATQYPSKTILTEMIKKNIPARITFSLFDQKDSRFILNQEGAENLLGKGDMLFLNNEKECVRVQGAWVSDEEVHAVVEYIKQGCASLYDPDIIERMESSTRTEAEKEDIVEEYDPKLAEAIDIVLEVGQASISMLQRRMRIGYARAGRLIDEMCRRGIISEADGAAPRKILMTREQINELFEDEDYLI